MPDGRVLYRVRNEDSMRCAVVTMDGSTDWAITYYVSLQGAILLLTVFSTANGDQKTPRDEVRAQLDRAIVLMERCKAQGDDVGEV